MVSGCGAAGGAPRYGGAMQAPSLQRARVPRRVRLALEIGWVIIIAKCLAVPWVVNHYQVPFGSGWVIVPTLLFAGLVTLLVVIHYDD